MTPSCRGPAAPEQGSRRGRGLPSYAHLPSLFLGVMLFLFATVGSTCCETLPCEHSPPPAPTPFLSEPLRCYTLLGVHLSAFENQTLGFSDPSACHYPFAAKMIIC